MNKEPSGWITTVVASLFESFSGGTPNRSNATFWNGSIPWVSSGDVKAETIDGAGSETITDEGLRQSSAKLCKPGSVIVVVRSGVLKHTLPVALASREVAINQDLKCFDSRNADLNKWLALSLRNDARKILELNREGTTVQSVKYETLKHHELRIPPLNEQKRIVEKLEKLLGKVEAAQERLDKIPVILKRFRQSVLAAACSGKLTADWRGNTEIDSETEFPASWSLVELGSLFPKGGIFDGPFGSNLKSSDYIGAGVRVVRLENVGHLRFIAEKESFVSEQKYETLKKHTVGKGDIIFSSFIADEIRACILPDLKPKAIAKADCFCLRPNGEVNRKYLLFQLVGRRTYDELVGFVHGATRPRINTTQLKTLTVPICPPEEQKEIVRRVEELFKFANQIEERYKKARSYTDRLTQSILAKAFRGELVPQDPNDEPASVLIERIKANGGPAKKKGA